MTIDMQYSVSNQVSQPVELYRVCYRCKETGATGRANGIDTFEDAQKRVHEFNLRYADDFVYFAEPVNINSLEPEQLFKLVNEGKLLWSQLGQ